MRRATDIKYHRVISLCDDALRILCCGRGDIRARLSTIDKEFFCLKQDQFPDIEGLRSDFGFLSSAVRKLKPRGNEGYIQATISRSQLNTLENIAQKICDIHHKLSTNNEFNKDTNVTAGSRVSATEVGELPFPQNDQ